MSRIFISYSRKDEDFARKLAHSLSEMGADIWIDVNDIPAGMKWSTAIQQGLNVCDVMLVVISPDSMASVNVEDEWQYYLDKQKHVIPIRWQPADVHFQLNRIQYVDFHQKPYHNAFERLLEELEAKGILFTNGSQKFSPISVISDVSAILPPPFEWCEIPAGKVIIEYSDSDQKTFDVPAFAMAKYPITNAQYEIFVREGYTEPRWWDFSSHARELRTKYPEPYERGYPGDDLPRTRISWYEAMAFCRWLTAKIEVQMVGTGGHITLPTEQQWQRAAQGDDGRIYPWGNTPDATRCNIEFRSEKPLPVTAHPTGASPFRVMDLSGNVSEWCLTSNDKNDHIDLKGDEHCVLRGGTWSTNIENVQCASRDWSYPEITGYGIGFRVAWTAHIHK